MLYVVEVPISAEPKRLIDEMGQMRNWLDHMDYRPVGFRTAGAVCRADFMDEEHAKAFATAFSGRVVGPAS